MRSKLPTVEEIEQEIPLTKRQVLDTSYKRSKKYYSLASRFHGILTTVRDLCDMPCVKVVIFGNMIRVTTDNGTYCTGDIEKFPNIVQRELIDIVLPYVPD